jgi:DNA-binding transcriptional regulator LsrR (DeoR family)
LPPSATGAGRRRRPAVLAESGESCYTCSGAGAGGRRIVGGRPAETVTSPRARVEKTAMSRRPASDAAPHRRRWHPAEESDELVFAVCRRFLEEAPKSKKGVATAIALWVRKEFRIEDFSRERVYALVWEAARRNMLLFNPPCHEQLAHEIATRFGIAEYRARPERIQVVNVRGVEANRAVCDAGADLILRLLRRLKQRGRKEVHLGLGSGASAMMVARRLAAVLRTDRNCPNLVLHALSTGGFSFDNPTRDAPITYFGLFEDALVDVDYVGLFCPTVVKCENYRDLQETPGVRESFEKRHKIDIVVTSFATADDRHGLLQRFFESVGGRRELRQLVELGWVGEIQFRPFSADGPILTREGNRAVTLFEIAELVELARTPDKFIVLLSAPCIACKKPRVPALRHLLTNPALKVWTHLVADVKTAVALLQEP